MAPRVTNNDLSDRLARLEEVGRNTAELLKNLPAVSDTVIRIGEGQKAQEEKLVRLFNKTDATDQEVSRVKTDIIPPVADKVNRVINYGAGVIGTLSLVGGLLMACGAYFISQQGNALQSVAETTKETAKAVSSIQLTLQATTDALDKRLSMMETQDQDRQEQQEHHR
jgi:hypothetical protein